MHKPLLSSTLLARSQTGSFGSFFWMRRSMLKWSAIAFCLLCMASCHPGVEFTTTKEYVENFEWDNKEGVVKTWKASCTTEWK